MLISKTPVRISFAGGGSDLQAYYKFGFGSVVSATLDKYIYVILNNKFVDTIRVVYSSVEYVSRVKDIKHEIMREAMKLVDNEYDWKGIDLVYFSDLLPAHEGSGLGSSSSLAVGALNALYSFQGKNIANKTLAEEACKIEIDILGRSIGKQDQYAAGFGGFNYIKFNSDESVEVTPIKLKEYTMKQLNSKLMMFYTNINTKSYEVLEEQRDNTKHNLPVLDGMVELSTQLFEDLKNDDITSFGSILHEGWLSKRMLASKISNAAIDQYYMKARNAGALGGKILGSGGGGFLLLYCEEDKQNKVRNALSNLRELPFGFDQRGSRICQLVD
jgi:D-glycero-alpha-D-manno-heptose-7-phosphate kinase